VKVVVDTNIIFSAILNSSSGIGKLLLTQNNKLDFHSCEYLYDEVLEHRAKLKKLTRLAEDELDTLISLVLRNVTFINDKLIPAKHTTKAIELTSAIDTDDSPFVALALHLKALLWTGDKKLLVGLRKQKVNLVVSTKELLQITAGL
jgi:putative PIN family toxin of toxin-antitoxin system